MICLITPDDETSDNHQVPQIWKLQSLDLSPFS